MVAKGLLWIGVVLCFVCLLFVAPCSAQKAPKGEAVIVIDHAPQISGGDPHNIASLGALIILDCVHEGLVKQGPDGRIIPALAKSWEVSNDGTVIKFTLDERARFHNGEPVTAEDIKFSIERLMRPEFKNFVGPAVKKHLERIEVVDSHHVTVHMKKPYVLFLDWSKHPIGIVPKAYVEKVGDAEFAKHPIGAGPFRWVDYQQDVYVKLEAVENHYRSVPKVKTVQLKFVLEPATRMAMFKSGEADVVPLTPSGYAEVKDDPKVKIVWSKFVFGPCLEFGDLVFPDQPSPFHDVRVRRAASYAINRKAICDNVLRGTAEPWGDILATYHPGVNPNLTNPYDPEKAKALLREAGYPNGFDTTFNCGLINDKVEVQAMAADLARVGIRAKIVEWEIMAYIGMLRERKFHGLRRSADPYWAGAFHPAPATVGICSSNDWWCYYTTPEIDAAWEKLSTLNEEKAIAAQAKELSRIWRESERRYMLWAIHQAFGLSAKVKYYEPIEGWRVISALDFLELKE